MRAGRHHSEVKPDVCWQLPLRCVEEQEDGTVVSTLSEFGRDGWGGTAARSSRWCTEAPEAFTGREPVYRSMGEELRKMLGSDALYRQVVGYLEQRLLEAPAGVASGGDSGPVLRRRPATANGRSRRS